METAKWFLRLPEIVAEGSLSKPTLYLLIPWCDFRAHIRIGELGCAYLALSFYVLSLIQEQQSRAMSASIRAAV